MGLLPDWEIRDRKCITPFAEGEKRHNRISYGLTSYGYDARLGEDIRIFTPVPSTGQIAVIDPTDFPEECFVKVEPYYDEVTGRSYFILPPNCFALGATVESFDIPRDCLCICQGKSTYARCGIIIPVTPLEPEWRGIVTVEIANTCSLPVRIYVLEGILQINFITGNGMCHTSYEDKKGKYQDQTGLTLPTIDSDEKLFSSPKNPEKIRKWVTGTNWRRE